MDGVCGPASPMGHWSASGAAAARAVRRRIGNHTDQKFSADLTLLLLLLLLALHYYDW